MRARPERKAAWWQSPAEEEDEAALLTGSDLVGLRRRSQLAVCAGLAGVLVLVILVATGWGTVRIPLGTIVQMCARRLGLLGDRAATWPATWETIIFTLRLPRVLLAGVVGASLAMAGATYQGLFRNPLADPYLIGVAAGAGLGATLATVLTLPPAFYRYGAVQWCAFAGALLAVALVYGLARVGGTTPLTTLLLAGVAISALASALTSLLMYWRGERLLVVYGWLLGGLTTASWLQLLQVLPYLCLSTLVLLPAARLLDALQLGEDGAAALGVNVERLKLLLVVTATLLTAAAISVSGLIGFVGLIVPHLVRLLWGGSYRVILPASLLGGAIFLIIADGLARSLLPIGEVPVGVLTALCGTPFFLVLLRRRKLSIF